MMIYRVNKDGILQVSLEDCHFFLSENKQVGLDIETTKKYAGSVFGEKEGLDPYTSSVIMIQFGNADTQYVVDARKTKDIVIQDLLERISDMLVVGHNLKFEYKHIFHNYGIRLNNLFDTQIAEMVLECGNAKARYSLKAVVEKYLGKDTSDEMDKTIRMQFLEIGDKDFTEEQILYGANDIVAPMRLKEAQERKLKYLELWKTFQEEVRFLPALASLEYNGMYLDKGKWMDIYRQNIEKYYKAENQLNSILESSPELFSPFLDENKKCSILWTSPKQVIPVMQTVGVDTWVKDKVKTKQTGKVSFKHSVEAKHLRKYMKIELVRVYIKYKNFQKYITSYGEEFLRHVNPITNRIHPDVWQIVSTGRTSCKEPNLQNITSGEFRSCFTPQNSKDVLISVDFSQQEPRITAHYSQDPALMDLFLHGDGDTHGLMARKVFETLEGVPQDITKENEGWSEKFNMTKRKVGKTINLGLDYGKSAYSLRLDLGITEDEAQSIYDSVRKSFPQKEKYFKRKREETLKKGFVLIDPIIGRKSFMTNQINRYKQLLAVKNPEKETISEMRSLEGTIQRSSQNFPIQGSAASMTKYALSLIYEYQLKNKAWDTFKVVNVVHDEIVIETNEEMANISGSVVQWAMVKAGKRFCSSIPMVAEPKISKEWSH